ESRTPYAERTIPIASIRDRQCWQRAKRSRLVIHTSHVTHLGRHGVLEIEHVVRRGAVDFWPTVDVRWHEDAAERTHAAERDGLSRRIIVDRGHAVNVIRSHGNAERPPERL